MSELEELRRAVEQDGADLTSDEALVLFAELDAARAAPALRRGDLVDVFGPTGRVRGQVKTLGNATGSLVVITPGG